MQQLLITTTLTVAVATSGTALAGAGLRVVPERVDFKTWPAGKTADVATWVVNAGDKPARVANVWGDDPLVAVDFAPFSLAPGMARQLRFKVTAPVEENAEAERTVHLGERGRDELAFTVSMRTVAPNIFPPNPWADPQSGMPLRCTPTVVELAPAAPGEESGATVWLINAFDTALRVGEFKGSCSCVKTSGWEPFTLEPGQAREMPVRMIAIDDPDGLAEKFVTFIPTGQRPVTVMLRQSIISPFQRRVERFLDAWDAGKPITAAAYVATGAIATDGSGAAAHPLDIPRLEEWAAWDAALAVERTYEAWDAPSKLKREDAAPDEPIEVTLVMWEQTDVRRHLQLPPQRIDVTVMLDEKLELAAITLRPVPDADEARSRLDRFQDGLPPGTQPRTAAAAKAYRAAIDG